MKSFLLKRRRPVIVGLHIGLIVAANALAFSLRFGGATPPFYWSLWFETILWLVAIRAISFMPFRLYEGLWRYTGISDLRNIVLGVRVELGRRSACSRPRWASPIPRSIILIDSLVLICAMGGARLGRRVYREWVTRRGNRRVLIYGAGDAGEQIVRNMNDDPRYGYHPVGFVDDNPSQDRRPHSWRAGARHRGTTSQRIFERCRPDEVVIALPERRCRRRPLARPTARAVQDSDQDAAQPARHRRWPHRREADPRPGHRRPAGASAGRPRPPPAPSPDGRQAGDGHRRRRIDRVRAVPADCRLEAGDAGDVRSLREHPARHPRRARRSQALVRRRPGDRRRDRRHPRECRARAAPAGDHLSRGGAQARAADGREPLRGGQEQRARHAAAGPGGRRARRRSLHHDLDRQGREPDQRDGRVQARRRARRPGPGGRQRDLVFDRALRQRARQQRQRRAAASSSRSRRAGRSRSPIPRCAGSSC